MFGISFEGGEYEPLFFLAAVRLAQQARYTEMSAFCRLYLLDRPYLLLINAHSFLLQIGNRKTVSDESTHCFTTQPTGSDSCLMDGWSFRLLI